MCLSDAARIVEITPDRAEATALIRGALRPVSLALLTLEGRAVEAGDWVLISAGLAIEQLTQSEADELLAITDRAEGEG